MPIDDSLEVLSEEECRALLEQETIGRVGLSVDALPAILPVNYSMVDGGIVFRTGEGAKLRAALSHTVVAFEVDHTDPNRQEGWSVLVVGVAEPVDARTEMPGHRAVPTPWAGGQSQHLVCIRPQMISGRRVAEPGRRPGTYHTTPRSLLPSRQQVGQPVIDDLDTNMEIWVHRPRAETTVSGETIGSKPPHNCYSHLGAAGG